MIRLRHYQTHMYSLWSLSRLFGELVTEFLEQMQVSRDRSSLLLDTIDDRFLTFSTLDQGIVLNEKNSIGIFDGSIHNLEVLAVDSCFRGCQVKKCQNYVKGYLLIILRNRPSFWMLNWKTAVSDRWWGSTFLNSVKTRGQIESHFKAILDVVLQSLLFSEWCRWRFSTRLYTRVVPSKEII